MYCDLLIIGGEGDLALRKLYPALYMLDRDGCLPECLRIIAMIRNAPSREVLTARIAERLEGEALDTATWERFAARLCVHAGDATAAESFRELGSRMLAEPGRDLIVYLATPPSIFRPVCQALEASGIVSPSTRIVVEKPMGHDHASFLEINRVLETAFDEQQIFRIDHYLGKETVQNLLAMRFANALFEPLWNHKYIDHVQISVTESAGVGGRWGFYDHTGALRDMMQNHILQLVTLVAMEPPANLEPEAVRDEKLKVLRSLSPVGEENVFHKTVRGQYAVGNIDGERVPGYLEEPDAAPASETETFAAVKATIDNWRWAGVPFYLRTGKRLQRRFSEIVIHFRDIPHSIFPRSPAAGLPNRLVIHLQPYEGIHLYLMSKVPGLESAAKIRPVHLNLSFSEAFRDRRTPEAYERLLLDVIRANSTLFVRADELDAAWLWIDRIRAGWERSAQPLVTYQAGSWGPAESIALLARDGRNWH